MKTKIILSLTLLISMLFSLSSCFFEGEVSTTTTVTTTTTTTTASDTENNGDPEYVLGDMPVIRVNCKNNAPVVSKEEYVDCTVSTSHCSDEYRFSNVSAGIRCRGNSSLPKDPINNQAPYRIKFDKKQSILGLNDSAECKSWVLLKPDMGNAIAFHLGQSLFVEEGYYCSDYQFVELYLNGQYRGVYILCEQSQINKNRVDVYETPEGFDSYKTGYFLEIDNYGYQEPEDHKFETNFGDVYLTDLEGNKLSSELVSVGDNINARWYVLKNDYVSSEQLEFIQKYIENVFAVAYRAIIQERYYELNSNFNLTPSQSSDPKEVIGKYIDLDSLVNMYLIQEISMNSDVGAGSFFMSVDFSEGAESNKLTFECPWDFNWAFRDTSRDVGRNYEGLSAATFCPDSFVYQNSSKKDRSNPWLILFMNAEWFRDMVRERWTELKEAGVFEESLEQMDMWIENYEPEFTAHFEQWRDNVYAKAVSNRKWLANRYTWLEDKLFSMDN